jgi:hypothetical protein
MGEGGDHLQNEHLLPEAQLLKHRIEQARRTLNASDSTLAGLTTGFRRRVLFRLEVLFAVEVIYLVSLTIIAPFID